MKRLLNSIRFKSIFGVEMLLLIFFLIVSRIGYRGFTNALLDQYSEDAFRTAKVAALNLEPDRINAYVQSGGKGEEYQKILKALERVCNASGSTFVYVIKPDQSDYKHIMFIFSTEGWNYHYQLYDFGYLREATNEEYQEKYRSLCEDGSSQELVVRDRGYIETEPHITAMIPLRGSDHQTKAIMCVQRQMNGMTDARQGYIRKLSFVLILLTLLVIISVGLFLNNLLLQPIKKITQEADRFANENKAAEVKLTDTIRNKDEIGRLAASIDRMEKEIASYVRDITQITGERERILTELSLEAESGLVSYVVVGVGVNCSRPAEQFPPALRQTAGSIWSQTGLRVNRNELTAAMIRALSALPALDWQTEYRAACVNLGQEVQILAPGQPPRQGQALDVDADAALLVQTEAGIERIQSGEVSVRGLYGYVPDSHG